MSLQRKDTYRISPEIAISDIGSYIKEGPEMYKYRKDRQAQEMNDTNSTKATELGTLLHSFILEPDTFSELYTQNFVEAPTGMMKTYIDYLIANEQHEPDQAVLHDAAYKASGFKISKEKVYNTFEDTRNQYYLKHQRDNRGKTSVSYDDMKTCTGIMTSLLGNELCRKYLDLKGYHDDSPVKTLSELEVYWKHPVTVNIDGMDIIEPLGCKAKIDKLLLDFENKKITVTDLKTTSKPVKSFINNYRDYSIYRQLAFYKEAALHYVDTYFEGDYSQWEVEIVIVAVETREPYTHRVFTPLKVDIDLGIAEYKAALVEIAGYMRKGVWKDTPKVEPISIFSFPELEP